MLAEKDWAQVQDLFFNYTVSFSDSPQSALGDLLKADTVHVLPIHENNKMMQPSRISRSKQ